MKDVKTKFNEYVLFEIIAFDTTPEADDDSGIINMPAVCLDGDYTYADLEIIKTELFRRIKTGELP